MNLNDTVIKMLDNQRLIMTSEPHTAPTAGDTNEDGTLTDSGLTKAHEAQQDDIKRYIEYQAIDRIRVEDTVVDEDGTAHTLTVPEFTDWLFDNYRLEPK